jgi:hypothetical protein
VRFRIFTLETAMSHYTLEAAGPDHEVVVGWDNQLETFFAQVWDNRNEEEESPVLWVGCRRGEVPSADLLAALVRPYAEIPEATLEQLQEDYAQRHSPERPQELADLAGWLDQAARAGSARQAASPEALSLPRARNQQVEEAVGDPRSVDAREQAVLATRVSKDPAHGQAAPEEPSRQEDLAPSPTRRLTHKL